MTSRRFESIGGILNRSTPSPGTQPTPPNTPGRGGAGHASRSLTTPSHDQPTAKASAKSDGGVRRVAFRLEPGLHEALTTRAAADKISHGQVVLDSIEAAH